MAQKSTNLHRAYIPVWWQYCLQWRLRRICSQSIIGRKSSPPHRTRETAGAATKQNQLYSPSTWILPKYFNPTSKSASTSNLIKNINTNIRSYDSLRKAAKSVLLDADNRNQGADQLVQLFNKPGFQTLPSTWQTKVLDRGWPICTLSSLLELTCVVRDLLSNWVPCTLILTVVHLWAALQTLWSSLSSDLQPLTPSPNNQLKLKLSQLLHLVSKESLLTASNCSWQPGLQKIWTPLWRATAGLRRRPRFSADCGEFPRVAWTQSADRGGVAPGALLRIQPPINKQTKWIDKKITYPQTL